MALLVDGDVSSIDGLRAQDTGVLDVANGEGISLAAKLELGEQELRIEIDRFLRQQTGGNRMSGSGQVQYSGQAVTLAQVAVSESLQLWHVLKTLESVYRDAYFSQLNDRYQQKWKLYQGLAEQQRKYYLNDDGVKIVANPVRRPQGVSILIEGGNLPAASYYVQATCLDEQGREGAPCTLVAASAQTPNSVTLSLVQPPANVVSWNVFVGLSSEDVTMQNTAPVAVTSAWRIPATGLIAGRAPGSGQASDLTILRATRNWRG